MINILLVPSFSFIDIPSLDKGFIVTLLGLLDLEILLNDFFISLPLSTAFLSNVSYSSVER